ncbi:Shedu immune nuclease family protein [Streptomyces triticirhizae]|uniref:hypothetical protein n=1 Tax=Streptomyces triticirhizae TaxID=2483353 RepID=UPI0011C39495|nr:hypothetical protein [Streptomyces triticirhizae]
MDLRRALDAIREEFGIETRRASATVLIGHPAPHPEVSETEISDTFRRLNSHVNRVEVVTYKELIDNAARAMNGPTRRAPRTRPAQDGPGSAPLAPEPRP